jgi:hypothetical protein
MIRSDQIPDEAAEAARMAIAKAIIDDQDGITAAIAAALNAWPGAFQWTFNGPLDGTGYVLPVEGGDV